MPAFGVVAEIVVGSFETSTIGARIEIPVDAITWADLTPAIASGAGIRIPVDAVTLVNPVPRLSAGKRITLDPTVFAIEESARWIVSVSAYIKIPVDPASPTWAQTPARISGGRSVRITAQPFTWVNPTPSMRSGGGIRIPAQALTEVDDPQSMRSGYRGDIDVTDLEWLDTSMRVTIGTLVGIHNDQPNASYYLGVPGQVVADDAVGSYSVALVRDLSYTDFLGLDIKVPRMSSGGAGRIPPLSLTFTTKTLEVAARRRRLKVMSILS